MAPENAFRYALRPDGTVPRARLPRLIRAATALARCDVLHLYGGESFFGGRLHAADARAMQRLGRRAVMEFVGSDARLTAVEQARNPYYVPPVHVDDEGTKRRLELWAEICDGHTIVGDHSLDVHLEPYFPHRHIVGQRLDTQRYERHPPSEKVDVPVIVHAPSSPLVKGTEALRRGVDELKQSGARFKYVEIQGMRQAEALQCYADADLVVDQLRAGSHGQFAVEAMSLAKPVVCFIQPALVPLYPPDLPLINANPDTIRDVLADWIQRPRDRRELGLASRAYVERQHDVRVVARRLLDAYEQLRRIR